MKKLSFFLMAVAMFAFVACNNAPKEEVVEETPATEVVEEAPVVVEVPAEEVPAEAAPAVK